MEENEFISHNLTTYYTTPAMICKNGKSNFGGGINAYLIALDLVLTEYNIMKSS